MLHAILINKTELLSIELAHNRAGQHRTPVQLPITVVVLKYLSSYKSSWLQTQRRDCMSRSMANVHSLLSDAGADAQSQLRQEDVRESPWTQKKHVF